MPALIEQTLLVEASIVKTRALPLPPSDAVGA